MPKIDEFYEEQNLESKKLQKMVTWVGFIFLGFIAIICCPPLLLAIIFIGIPFGIIYFIFLKIGQKLKKLFIDPEADTNLTISDIEILWKKIPKDNYNLLGYITILYILGIVFCVFCNGVNHMDYGFFMVLKWFITVFSSWTTYKIYLKNNKSRLLLLFGAITILFNPVFKITFDDDFWFLLDIITLCIFTSWLFVYNKKFAE